MASILVTGGAGFIGSALCTALMQEGHAVYAVDNFITGTPRHMRTLEAHGNFRFAQGDISEPGFVEFFGRTRFDTIYHLACPTGVPNIKTLGVEMLKVCSYGMFNVLEVAKRNDARLIFSSTAEVYGQPEVSPQDEDYNGNVSPIGARSAYEEGKRFSEACIATFVSTQGVNASIVRIFNTYGPSMSLSDQRVIPQFIRAIKAGEALRIYGDGSQIRTHMYVDDLIRGIELVARKGVPGEAYNIGSDRQTTIRELAEMLIEKTGHAAGIDFEPHFIEDHLSRLPGTAKVRALGWSMQVPLEEGLDRMLEAHIGTEPRPTRTATTPVEEPALH